MTFYLLFEKKLVNNCDRGPFSLSQNVLLEYENVSKYKTLKSHAVRIYHAVFFNDPKVICLYLFDFYNRTLVAFVFVHELFPTEPSRVLVIFFWIVPKSTSSTTIKKEKSPFSNRKLNDAFYLKIFFPSKDDYRLNQVHIMIDYT